MSRAKVEIAATWVVLGDWHGVPRHADDEATASVGWHTALCDDLARLRKAHDLAVDHVLVAGDIVHHPSRRAYAAATESLRRVTDAAGVTMRELFAVPGNHDVDRRRVDGDLLLSALHDTVRVRPARMDRAVAEYSDALVSPFSAFGSFAAQCAVPEQSPGWFGAAASWFSHRAGRPKTPVRVVGWNSVLASDASDARGSLVLPEGMIASVSSAAPDEVVAVLCHHPIEWLADGPRLRSVLDEHAHVYLHSHDHESTDAPRSRPSRTPGGSWILPVGGAYVGPRSDASWRVRYLVMRIELRDDGPVMRVWPRAASLSDSMFAPAIDSSGPSVEGESWILPIRPPRVGWIRPGARAARPSASLDELVAPFVGESVPAASLPRRSVAPGVRRAMSLRAMPAVRPGVRPLLPELDEGAFFGRFDALRALRERIGGGVELCVIGVHGAPGEGKTALLRRFATRARDEKEFAGGVFWLDAQHPASLRASWELAALGVGAPHGTEPARTRFATTMKTRGPFLLVLDGIHAASAIHDARAAVAGLPATVLFSATESSSVTSVGASAHFLAPLPMSDALGVLEKASAGIRDPVALSQVSKLLGRNALALTVAGRMLPAGPGLSRYVDTLARAVGAGGASTAGAVYALLDLLWTSLEEPARDAWRLLASFVPQTPVVQTWVDRSASALSDAARRSLPSLVAAGIAHRDESMGLWRLHSLAHAFGRVQVTALDEPAFIRHARAFARGAIESLGPILDLEDSVLTALATTQLEPLDRIRTHCSPEDESRVAAIILVLAARMGGPAAVGAYRHLLDDADTPHGLGASDRRVWALDVLEAVLAHERVTASPDRSTDGSAAVRLASLLRQSGSREGIENARTILEESVRAESGRDAPSASRVAALRLELAQVFLKLGGADAVAAARAHVDAAREDAQRAGADRGELIVRAYSVAVDVDAAQKMLT